MSPRKPWDRAKQQDQEQDEDREWREQLRQADEARDRRIAALGRRVTDLEAEVSEMRRHNLRLAEMADVIQELLIPMSGRDEDRVREAIDRFNASI